MKNIYENSEEFGARAGYCVVVTLSSSAKYHEDVTACGPDEALAILVEKHSLAPRECTVSIMGRCIDPQCRQRGGTALVEFEMHSSGPETIKDYTHSHLGDF